jgi:cytochrome c oxidase assembly protein subunit 15
MAGEPSGTVRRFAAATAGVTLLLILAGGFVTTTRTGDTIPSWPKSWGRMEAGWPVEWTHRAIAGTLAVMVFALAFLLQKREPRSAIRRLGWIAFAAVVLQALLGGLRIYLPRPAVAIVHACFAQLVFCAMVGVAVLAGKGPASAPGGPAEARGLGFAATAAAFLQLVAGAITRHTGAGLEVHVAGALVVLVLGSLFASRLVLSPLRRGAWLLLALLGSQLALGVSSWAITRSASFVRSIDAPALHLAAVSAHVAAGAAILAACLVLSLRCAAQAPSLEPARP